MNDIINTITIYLLVFCQYPVARYVIGNGNDDDVLPFMTPRRMTKEVQFRIMNICLCMKCERENNKLEERERERQRGLGDEVVYDNRGTEAGGQQKVEEYAKEEI
eukprot:760264_1